MSRLYKRRARVTIASPRAGSFFGQDLNQLQIEDLKVTFDIEKTLRKEPNSASLVIYNLAERTRAALQKKPLQLRLEVGYETSVKQIFFGDLRYVQSIKGRTDWITRIELGDGERAYRYARVNRSFRKGSKISDAIRDVAAQLNLSLPESISDTELQSTFAAGVSLHGPAFNELVTLLKPYGYDASIQDGQLQILKNTATRAREVVLINESTGMLGTPEFGIPEKKNKKPVLTVRCLLNADIVPGGRILVKSNSINGIFKVLKVRFAGDTHGSDWFSEVEAVAV